MAPRSIDQRKADTLEKLQQAGGDVWVATARDGAAHLIPLSYAWVRGCVVIACEDSSLTARNILTEQRARLGFGPTRDVVMIDADLQRSQPAGEVDDATAQAYAEQAGWDARVVENNLMLFLEPRRIQAWRESDELEERTVMKAGHWLA